MKHAKYRCIAAGVAGFWTALAVADIAVDRVEPPHWYRGFDDSSLQIMLYGDNIAAADVALTGDGARLERSVRTANPNYLFVYLVVAPSGGERIELSLSRGNDERRIRYELRDRRDDMPAGFDSSDVIYLVTPDRFANGDPSNDRVTGFGDELNRGEPDARHGGDIRGLIDHLDYIAEMGFTQLWPNPVLENRMDSGSYHGYATTDFYSVDPRFGDDALYLELVAAARARGIGLIKDMIVNHIGSNHWWMRDLPTPDWLNNAAAYRETTHARTAIQDPYAAPTDVAGMADGWFVPTMPDLNQRQPLLADYLIQNALWWIETAGLAGIRMDTYPYPDKDFMAAWTARIVAEYPGFSIVGEEWSLNPVVISYWQRGKDNFDGYRSELSSVMDFPLQDALVRSLTVPEEPYKNVWTAVYEMLANDHLYPDPMQLVVFGDNHDMDRLYTQLGEDPALLQMALALLATMRGIPQFYYGTEVLLSNPGTHSHGVIRGDFPGGWAGDAVDAFSGEGLSAEATATQAMLRKLLQWRRTASAIHSGNLQHYTPQDSTYVYFRYDDAQTVMVIANRSAEPATLDLARFRQRLGAARSAYDVVAERAVRLRDTLTIAPRSVRVLDIEPD
ncbi:MAG: glycoside hydrolase family 13 protein [Pseudomonadota bacterium]